jgi:hypothetical protein
MRPVRPFVLLALAALLAGGQAGCFSGCDQEMDHGGTNSDAAAAGDGGASDNDAGLPLCPDAGPPPDASMFDAGMFDAGVYDAGPPPDAGTPTCRYPWDAGPGSG